MSTNNTPAIRRSAAPLAVRIPLTVLATLPEKLRLLSESIKLAAVAPSPEFRAKHNAVRRYFDESGNAANCSVNSFTELQDQLTTQPQQRARAAALRAQRLISAIYKASGNIHNDDCFRTTFDNGSTVDATVASLQECGDIIRAAVRPFGY